MDDLILQLNDKRDQLNVALRSMRRRAEAKAEAERKYRVALAQKILQEREAGTPVTIINDVCRGSKEIAQLRFDRDVAESLYDTAREAINIYKRECTILEEQISREWNNG